MASITTSTNVVAEFGGKMRHFILFIAAVFAALFLAVLNKSDSVVGKESTPILRVFGYSSFTGKFGPGPILKDLFESKCNCVVEFIEGSDSGILLQRLRIEGESLGADVVVGLDQFDLSKALAQQKWKELKAPGVQVDPSVQGAMNLSFFLPFDWGPMAINIRKGEGLDQLASLDDLLDPKWKNQIALQDPRTSSPGMQFLYWVLQAKGEEAGFEYIRSMTQQVQSYSPNWSLSYGLFTKKQAKAVLSYQTSPLYHLIEEGQSQYQALQFKEGHPIQIEFMGIPEFCRNCELAEQFVAFMLSPEAQRTIMKKNYMLPVLADVRAGTPFQDLPRFEAVADFRVIPMETIDQWLKRWSEIRRGESN